jgi:MFS family permease
MVMMGLVRSFTGLIVARVFLGMMEAGYFPGVAFYLTNFYKRDELAFRIAIFFSMATFAGAFGGLIAYGIGFIKGVGEFKNSWHWIFIIGKKKLFSEHSDNVDGLLTVIVSLIAPFFILDVSLLSSITL